MNLKPYQTNVLENLQAYLELLTKTKNLETAWNEYHKDDDAPAYRDKISGVPNVCLKIPTGGGKTFLACAALKKIFDALPREHKFVVWLVPSDAILTQTVNALKDTNHPYRKKINKDFEDKVIVYDKEMLLQGQNFSPITVEENLSICVMSYAALRINSQKKDIRKVYNENGILNIFAQYFKNPDINLADTPESALINIVRAMNPVVVVDESHNATSDLSVEMLKILNPSFVLELTATPRKFSNNISEVESTTLKAANMVKLPVIVYNPFDKETLIESVINFRDNLEEIAASEKNYIRPIALFQAAPNTSDDAETFEKIKQNLIGAGIKKEEIAIKTANINELDKKDLMSAECPIRYIITINALKEGWDCPFAYVLASLANKQSPTDVEQLVGRILRQPYTAKCENKFLNSAYVFTCSVNFGDTVEKIVKTLNGEGFSKDDVQPIKGTFEQNTLDFSEKIQNDSNAQNLSTQAAQVIDEYNAGNETAVIAPAVSRGGKEMKTYKVKEDFKADIENLKIPQFFQEIPRSNLVEDDLFASGKTAERLLTPENLSEGFNLNEQDKKIIFDIRIDEIDVEGERFSSSTLSLDKAKEYQELLDQKTPEERVKFYTDEIFKELRNWKRAKFYKLSDLKKYIGEIVGNMSADELDNLNLKTLPAYIQQIKNKISELDDEYRKERFNELIKEKKIFCKGNYKLKNSIQLDKTGNTIKKSLYEYEGVMNDFETKLISKVAGIDNVEWWHRNTPQEFNLNGFINHYPDFIVKMKSGKVILIETKGEHLKNDDSHEKLKLADDWISRAGEEYNYFMVFDDTTIPDRNACTLNKFLQIISEL